MKLLLSSLYLVFTSWGLLFMKMGGDSLMFSFKNGVQFRIGFLTLLGFIFYIGSFLLWQKLLVSSNLSYIFPILTGIVQILVLLMGVFIFKESVNITNILGIIFIMIGILLIAKK